MDGVVGVKRVKDPVLTIVVSTSSYLDFISYTVALASLCTIDLDRRRRSSCGVSWIRSDVFLSIGYVVGDVTSGIDLIVCWGVSHRIGWSIRRNVGSRVDWLCYFIFASSFFSHRVEGTLSTTSLARDASICFWSRNLLWIYCIRDLFLRSEQLQHRRWLGGTRSLENLQGGLGR
jgi:hypothetical protein